MTEGGRKVDRRRKRQTCRRRDCFRFDRRAITGLYTGWEGENKGFSFFDVGNR